MRDTRGAGMNPLTPAAHDRFADSIYPDLPVVVAADGIHSALQQHVVAPSLPLPSGSVAYRGVVTAAAVGWPAGAMRNWLGTGRHFLVYPVRAGQLLNYVGFVPAATETELYAGSDQRG